MSGEQGVARARYPSQRELVFRYLAESPDPLPLLATATRLFRRATDAQALLVGHQPTVRWHYHNMKAAELAKHPDNPAAVAELDLRKTRAYMFAAIEYAVLRGVTFASPEDVVNAQVFDEP